MPAGYVYELTSSGCGAGSSRDGINLESAFDRMDSTGLTTARVSTYTPTNGVHREGDVRGGFAIEAVQPRRADRRHDREQQRHAHGGQSGNGHFADLTRVDHEAEVEEEQRTERITQREHQPLDPLLGDRSRQDEAGHERSDRIADTQLVRDSCHQQGEPDEEHDKQLVVRRADDASDDSPAIPCQQAERDQERKCAHEQQHRFAGVGGGAQHRRESGEVQREEQVFEHDDAKDQARLGVPQSP